jgi:hypothetical protein
MTASRTPSPLGATAIVDEYFIENRNRLLEIAAFLDRVDRADAAVGASDFRMRALAEGIAALTGAAPNRLTHIQMVLTDPRTEPLPALDRKGAVGAFDPALSEKGR